MTKLLKLLPFIALLAQPAMARDLALGDSIALGTGRALGVETVARVGASSCWIAARVPHGHFANVVVSAGVNDEPGLCLAALRAKLNADRVVWIRPINSAGPHVDLVASQFGDRVLYYSPGRDHLHPASYAAVAADVRRAWAR